MGIAQLVLTLVVVFIAVVAGGITVLLFARKLVFTGPTQRQTPDATVATPSHVALMTASRRDRPAVR